MTSPETASIEQTKEALKEHASLPLIRRVGRRAVGNYPSIEQREELRRHEIGTSGRVIEDTRGAIKLANKLNRTGRAVLGGPWITASPTGTEKSATLPVSIKEADDRQAIINLFQAGERESNADDADSIGFLMDDYTTYASHEDVDRLTLVAMEDGNYIDSVTLDKEQIDGLSAGDSEVLESIADRVLRHSTRKWVTNKPDDV